MIIFEEIFARDSIVLCQINILTSQVSKKILFCFFSNFFWNTAHTKSLRFEYYQINLMISNLWHMTSFFQPKSERALPLFEGIRRLHFFWGISNSLVSWWRMVYDTSFRRADSYDCYFLMSEPRISRCNVSKHLLYPASNSKF